MKKALSLLLALIMCLSLFACGEPSGLDQSEKKDKDSTSATKPSAGGDALDENDPWGEDDTNSPADDTEDDEIIHVSSIRSATPFSEGVAFVQYEDPNEEDFKIVAIDTTGKVLFEMPAADISYVGFGYKNGILVIGDYVYDKTGTVIASPEISGYTELLTKNCNGYVLAGKKEESFHGDKYYIGVLNNKGEWEHPLSIDHPIVKVFEEAGYSAADWRIDSTNHYISDSIIKVDVRNSTDRYYNIVTNELTDGYIHYESSCSSVHNMNEDDGIYRFDTLGNRTLILKHIIGDVFFEDAFVGRTAEWDEDGKVIESGYRLYDYSGNVIVDLSEYNCNGRDIRYVNNHLLFQADNGTGSTYLCLVDKDGELVFEPIKIGAWDEVYFLDENGLVYASNGECFIYDYSGNVTELANDIKAVWGFSEGLTLIKGEAYGYYHSCYYVNLEGERVIG